MSIYEDDSIKRLRFFANDEEITHKVIDGTFNCENILCASQLAFGECNSARAQLKTYENLNLTNSTIRVDYGIDDTWETIGTYKVSQTTTKINSDEVTLTMYDALKSFDVDVADWYIGLVFPMTLRQFRNALISHIGVTQEDTNLCNDDMVVYETIAPSSLKATELLKYIGEINGVFPHCDRFNELKWISLGVEPRNISPSLINGPESVEMKAYYTSPISKLVIRQEDGDIGVSIGGIGNVYYVTNNVLVYGLSTEQLQPIALNLYNKIEGTSYKPTKMNMKSIPSVEMGDKLLYGNDEFYVLSKKTDGILFDEIEAAGNQYLKEDNTVKTEIAQLRGKSNVLKQTIEENSSKITNIEKDYTTYTEFKQTADGIQMEISSLQSQMDGSLELFYVQEAPTKYNYPYWDWTGMFADDTYYASDDLYFLYPDTALQKHVRTMCYDENTTLTYRFIKESGQFYWQELADTETSVILSRVSKVEATTEGLSSEVAETKLELNNNYWTKVQAQSAINQKANEINLSVSSTYEPKAHLQDNYYTKVETQSAINQKANEITLAVSGTYATKQTTTNLSAEISLKLNKKDLVSEINASADIIKLKSGRLIIESGNFQLNANGNITCNGGNIAGWNITSSALYADVGSNRAYFQKPTALTSWVYSVQELGSGGTNKGLWYVRADGYMYAGNGISIKGDCSINGNLTGINNATVNGTLKATDITAAGRKCVLCSSNIVLTVRSDGNLQVNVDGVYKGIIKLT